MTMCHQFPAWCRGSRLLHCTEEELCTSRASSKHFLTSSTLTSGLAESWMATKAAF